MAVNPFIPNWKTLTTVGMLSLLCACQPAVSPKPMLSPSASPTQAPTSALALNPNLEPKVVFFPLKGQVSSPAPKFAANQPWQAESLVGSGSADFADGSGEQASLAYPWGLAINPLGEILIADRFNHRIRKLKDKTLSTLAGQREPGNTDGPGAQSRLNNPQGVSLGPKSELYVADTGSGTIRRVTADGQVTTLVKDLQNPADVVADANGNLIVAEAGAHRLLFWSATSHEIYLLAGQSMQDKQDGPALKAGFFAPRGLALAPDGTLYIADSLNHLIRKISREGIVSTLAGDGNPGLKDAKGQTASFNEPGALALDESGQLLVVDVGNAKVRRITPAGEVNSLNLPDSIRQPQGIAINGESIWLSDSRRHSIFRLKPLNP